MRNLDVSVPRYKIIKKEVIDVDADQYDELIIKKHKLTGWFVVDKAEMFKSKSFVMGLNNDNKVGSLYMFDLTKIEELFTEIYSYLVSELSNGSVQRRPTESACTYCDYASICWYKGKVEDPLVISDIEISMGKGEEA